MSTSAQLLRPTACVDFEDPTHPQAPRLRCKMGAPVRWLVARSTSDVPGLLDDAHGWAIQGGWAVGWVTYEAAAAFGGKLPVKRLPDSQPFAVWALYGQDSVHPWPKEEDALGNTVGTLTKGIQHRWKTSPWAAEFHHTVFHGLVERIQDLIRMGEVYQINLTAQHTALLEGGDLSVLAYFDALRRAQSGGYGLMLDARAASSAPSFLLSASPELFFDWHGDVLTTRPMKGTAPRGADATQDQHLAQALRSSQKERAENLMIVDLLRNDLSKLAQTGSVRVPTLFDVRAWPTVWQMTSTITAKAHEGLHLSDVFEALFPCGSVTGAPKRRAMHHIASMEMQPRGVYCGAAGVMQPGGRVTMNVPIRTVCLHARSSPGKWAARCGIGSAITLDSQASSEWLEWAAKLEFLRRASRD